MSWMQEAWDFISSEDIMPSLIQGAAAGFGAYMDGETQKEIADRQHQNNILIQSNAQQHERDMMADQYDRSAPIGEEWLQQRRGGLRTQGLLAPSGQKY